MTTPSVAVPEAAGDLQSGTQTHPLYWSIRRELWENHSIYVAPLIAVGLGVLVFVIMLIQGPHHMDAQGMLIQSPHHTDATDAMGAMDPAQPLVELVMPYSHTAWLAVLTAFLVGFFYCLDALHGERRDRSILFWKSLPVSDFTAVLAKALIPLAVLPLLVLVFSEAAQLIMLVLHATVFSIVGGSVVTLWARLPFFQMQLVLLYSLIVVSLWHAPLYMWCLLVSGWARRTVFLWAVLPPLAACALEYLIFHKTHFCALLKDRLFGFDDRAFNLQMPDGTTVDPHFIPLTQIAVGKFLSTPGLWVGLVLAAVMLAAAVRLRRYREPI